MLPSCQIKFPIGNKLDPEKMTKKVNGPMAEKDSLPQKLNHNELLYVLGGK